MHKFIALLFLLSNCCVFAQTRVIDSIRELADKAPDKEEALYQQSFIVTKLFAAGFPKESQELLDASLREAMRVGSDKALGALYKSAGTLHFYHNNLDSALAGYEKSIAYMKKAGDLAGIVKSTSNIGNIYGMWGNIDKAMDYYRDALTQEAQLGEDEGALVPLNNIATLYLRRTIIPKAIYYFRKAEKISKKRGALSELSTSYDGLARVYTSLRKYDSAMYYAVQARDISEQIGHLGGYTYALANIASIYNGRNMRDSAIITLREALPLVKMMGDARLEFAILANLAAANIMENRADSAEIYLEKAGRLQKDMNVQDYDLDFTQIFAAFYAEKQDYKKAYEYQKVYVQLKDSLFEVDINAKLAEMQEKYETDKKEKENRLLQSENEMFRTTRNYLILSLALALLCIAGGIFAFTRIKRANVTIKRQKALVEEKQKEILDSINYARRIQFALLSSGKLLESNLPQHFVFFKPKDVVSGDFYWASPTGDGFLLIAGDCTGHGVPGAFMSLLNITKLSQVINEQKITRPDLVLNKVREEIIHVLNPADSHEESRDGMDAVLCKFNLPALKLEFAAANNALYLVRNSELIAWKADKMPVGKGHDDSVPFTFNEISLQKDDMIYLFTDGFADQFGGPMGKKFKYKQFEKLLISICHETMEAQKQALEKAFTSWRGSLEQVDDVCVIGVRI